MIPEACITHSVPGRVRFKVPAMRRHEDYFAQAEHVLGDCPEVNSYRVDARTGSILVNFKRDADVSQIAAYAEQAGLFRLSDRIQQGVTVIGRAMGHVAQFDDRLRSISYGQANLRTLFIVILVGFGLTQILTRRATGIASIMLWYAFDLARAEFESRREEPESSWRTPTTEEGGTSPSKNPAGPKLDT